MLISSKQSYRSQDLVPESNKEALKALSKRSISVGVVESRMKSICIKISQTIQVLVRVDS